MDAAAPAPPRPRSNVAAMLNKLQPVNTPPAGGSASAGGVFGRAHANSAASHALLGGQGAQRSVVASSGSSSASALLRSRQQTVQGVSATTPDLSRAAAVGQEQSSVVEAAVAVVEIRPEDLQAPVALILPSEALLTLVRRSITSRLARHARLERALDGLAPEFATAVRQAALAGASQLDATIAATHVMPASPLIEQLVCDALAATPSSAPAAVATGVYALSLELLRRDSLLENIARASEELSRLKLRLLDTRARVEAEWTSRPPHAVSTALDSAQGTMSVARDMLTDTIPSLLGADDEGIRMIIAANSSSGESTAAVGPSADDATISSRIRAASAAVCAHPVNAAAAAVSSAQRVVSAEIEQRRVAGQWEECEAMLVDGAARLRGVYLRCAKQQQISDDPSAAGLEVEVTDALFSWIESPPLREAVRAALSVLDFARETVVAGRNAAELSARGEVEVGPSGGGPEPPSEVEVGPPSPARLSECLLACASALGAVAEAEHVLRNTVDTRKTLQQRNADALQRLEEAQASLASLLSRRGARPAVKSSPTARAAVTAVEIALARAAAAAASASRALTVAGDVVRSSVASGASTSTSPPSHQQQHQLRGRSISTSIDGRTGLSTSTSSGDHPSLSFEEEEAVCACEDWVAVVLGTLRELEGALALASPLHRVKTSPSSQLQHVASPSSRHIADAISVTATSFPPSQDQQQQRQRHSDIVESSTDVRPEDRRHDDAGTTGVPDGHTIPPLTFNTRPLQQQDGSATTGGFDVTNPPQHQQPQGSSAASVSAISAALALKRQLIRSVASAGRNRDRGASGAIGTSASIRSTSASRSTPRSRRQSPNNVRPQSLQVEVGKWMDSLREQALSPTGDASEDDSSKAAAASPRQQHTSGAFITSISNASHAAPSSGQSPDDGTSSTSTSNHIASSAYSRALLFTASQGSPSPTSTSPLRRGGQFQPQPISTATTWTIVSQSRPPTSTSIPPPPPPRAPNFNLDAHPRDGSAGSSIPVGEVFLVSSPPPHTNTTTAHMNSTSASSLPVPFPHPVTEHTHADVEVESAHIEEGQQQQQRQFETRSDPQHVDASASSAADSAAVLSLESTRPTTAPVEDARISSSSALPSGLVFASPQLAAKVEIAPVFVSPSTQSSIAAFFEDRRRRRRAAAATSTSVDRSPAASTLQSREAEAGAATEASTAPAAPLRANGFHQLQLELPPASPKLLQYPQHQRTPPRSSGIRGHHQFQLPSPPGQQKRLQLSSSPSSGLLSPGQQIVAAAARAERSRLARDSANATATAIARSKEAAWQASVRAKDAEDVLRLAAAQTARAQRLYLRAALAASPVRPADLRNAEDCAAALATAQDALTDILCARESSGLGDCGPLSRALERAQDALDTALEVTVTQQQQGALSSSDIEVDAAAAAAMAAGSRGTPEPTSTLNAASAAVTAANDDELSTVPEPSLSVAIASGTVSRCRSLLASILAHRDERADRIRAAASAIDRLGAAYRSADAIVRTAMAAADASLAVGRLIGGTSNGSSGRRSSSTTTAPSASSLILGASGSRGGELAQHNVISSPTPLQFPLFLSSHVSSALDSWCAWLKLHTAPYGGSAAGIPSAPNGGATAAATTSAYATTAVVKQVEVEDSHDDGAAAASSPADSASPAITASTSLGDLVLRAWTRFSSVLGSDAGILLSDESSLRVCAEVLMVACTGQQLQLPQPAAFSAGLYHHITSENWPPFVHKLLLDVHTSLMTAAAHVAAACDAVTSFSASADLSVFSHEFESVSGNGSQSAQLRLSASIGALGLSADVATLQRRHQKEVIPKLKLEATTQSLTSTCVTLGTGVPSLSTLIASTPKLKSAAATTLKLKVAFTDTTAAGAAALAPVPSSTEVEVAAADAALASLHVTAGTLTAFYESTKRRAETLRTARTVRLVSLLTRAMVEVISSCVLVRGENSDSVAGGDADSVRVMSAIAACEAALVSMKETASSSSSSGVGAAEAFAAGALITPVARALRALLLLVDSSSFNLHSATDELSSWTSNIRTSDGASNIAPLNPRQLQLAVAAPLSPRPGSLIMGAVPISAAAASAALIPIAASASPSTVAVERKGRRPHSARLSPTRAASAYIAPSPASSSISPTRAAIIATEAAAAVLAPVSPTSTFKASVALAAASPVSTSLSDIEATSSAPLTSISFVARNDSTDDARVRTATSTTITAVSANSESSSDSSAAHRFVGSSDRGSRSSEGVPLLFSTSSPSTAAAAASAAPTLTDAAAATSVILSSYDDAASCRVGERTRAGDFNFSITPAVSPRINGTFVANVDSRAAAVVIDTTHREELVDAAAIGGSDIATAAVAAAVGPSFFSAPGTLKVEVGAGELQLQHGPRPRIPLKRSNSFGGDGRDAALNRSRSGLTLPLPSAVRSSTTRLITTGSYLVSASAAAAPTPIVPNTSTMAASTRVRSLSQQQQPPPQKLKMKDGAGLQQLRPQVQLGAQRQQLGVSRLAQRHHSIDRQDAAPSTAAAVGLSTRARSSSSTAAISRSLHQVEAGSHGSPSSPNFNFAPSSRSQSLLQLAISPCSPLGRVLASGDSTVGGCAMRAISLDAGEGVSTPRSTAALAAAATVIDIGSVTAPAQAVIDIGTVAAPAGGIGPREDNFNFGAGRSTRSIEYLEPPPAAATTARSSFVSYSRRGSVRSEGVSAAAELPLEAMTSASHEPSIDAQNTAISASSDMSLPALYDEAAAAAAESNEGAAVAEVDDDRVGGGVPLIASTIDAITDNFSFRPAMTMDAVTHTSAHSTSAAASSSSGRQRAFSSSSVHASNEVEADAPRQGSAPESDSNTHEVEVRVPESDSDTLLLLMLQQQLQQQQRQMQPVPHADGQAVHTPVRRVIGGTGKLATVGGHSLSGARSGIRVAPASSSSDRVSSTNGRSAPVPSSVGVNGRSAPLGAVPSSVSGSLSRPPVGTLAGSHQSRLQHLQRGRQGASVASDSAENSTRSTDHHGGASAESSTRSTDHHGGASAESSTRSTDPGGVGAENSTRSTDHHGGVGEGAGNSATAGGSSSSRRLRSPAADRALSRTASRGSIASSTGPRLVAGPSPASTLNSRLFAGPRGMSSRGPSAAAALTGGGSSSSSSSSASSRAPAGRKKFGGFLSVTSAPDSKGATPSSLSPSPPSRAMSRAALQRLSSPKSATMETHCRELSPGLGGGESGEDDADANANADDASPQQRARAWPRHLREY